MLKKLLDSRGLTLVEVLVSTALLSIVLLVITSFHIFGQNQFSNQKSQSELLSDVRLAMSDITKEIRKNDPEDIEIPSSSEILIDSTLYFLDGDKLWKKNTETNQVSDFIDGIEHFQPLFLENGTGIEIYISSTNEIQRGEPFEYTSEIYFRK